jgi:hypothetical protein
MSMFQVKATLGLVLALTLSTAAHAWDNPTQAAVCGKEVTARLQKLGSKEEWIREVDPVEKTQAYRTPTKKIGSWIELRRTTEGTVELRTISALGVEQYKWGKTCTEAHAQMTTGKVMAHAENGKKFFFDSDLASLVKKNKEGLVYIWSPSLVYSMRYYSRFKEMADKLNLPMTVLMDPQWRQGVAKEMAGEYNMPFYDTRAESVEFAMRDVGLHFPATIVYANGKIARRVIFGIEEPQRLSMLVTTELEALKK